MNARDTGFIREEVMCAAERIPLSHHEFHHCCIRVLQLFGEDEKANSQGYASFSISVSFVVRFYQQP